MASARTRAVATGISVLAGVVVGISTNIVTDSKSGAWAVALGTAAIVLIGSQVWLSFSASPQNVTAAGRGSVAAGGSIDADIDIEVTGQASRTSHLPPSGVSALEPGSVAAGGNIKGRIRSRQTKR